MMTAATSTEAAIRIVESIANWAWRASWQGALLAIVVMLVLVVMGKKISPSWRFALWGLVLVRLAMPPLIDVSWKAPTWIAQGPTPSSDAAVRTQAPTGAIASLEEAAALIDAYSSADRKRAASPPVQTVAPAANAAPATLWAKLRSARFPTLRIAIWTWLAGIALLALRVVWCSARLARAVSQMKPITQPHVLEALRSCCREMGLPRIPQVRELPASGAPALVGFLRPKVLLPVHVIDQMAEAELRLILLHELAHVKRRDVLINWLSTLVALLHWPNPAVWLVLWRMRAERELACDEMVLRVGSDPAAAAYARTIVKLVEALSGGNLRGRGPAAVPGGAVGILEGKAQIQRRLLMIARFDAKSRRWPVVAAAMGLIVGALALSGATRAADKPVNPATGAPTGRPAPLDPATGAPAAPQAKPAAALFSPSFAVTPVSPEEEKVNARTAEKLNRPLSKIAFNGQGFADVVDFIRDAAGVDVIVEWQALEAAGITRDFPVTLQLREPAPADAVLRLMFRAMGLGLQYEIDKGVVVIGPMSRPASVLTRVYDVSDLVAAGPAVNVAAPGAFSPAGAAPAAGGGALAGPGAGAFGGPGGEGAGLIVDAGEVAQLIRLIVSTIQPDTWRDNGGDMGSIAFFKNKLVVKTSENVHKEIVALLEMLREKPAAKADKLK